MDETQKRGRYVTETDGGMSKFSYQLVKLGERCLKVLPFSWVVFLFQVGGLFLFYIDRRKREVGFRNIKLAFPHKSYKEIVSILRKSFLNFGMNIGEILLYSPRTEKVVFEEEDFLSKETKVCDCFKCPVLPSFKTKIWRFFFLLKRLNHHIYS